MCPDGKYKVAGLTATPAKPVIKPVKEIENDRVIEGPKATAVKPDAPKPTGAISLVATASLVLTVSVALF